LGIGVSTGTVLDGLIGSDLYRTRTVIGEEVNIAARIEALSLRGQVLMSEATYVHCQGFVDAGAPLEVHVKGRAPRLRMREALGIPRLGKTVPRQDLRRSPRVPVELSVDYWRVLAKVVGVQRLRAVIRDIGYHGVRMELKRPLPLYSELRLAFDLPRVELQARDVFARVVSVHKHWGARCVVGVEFTSLGAEADSKIRRFVQLGLQRHPEDSVPDPGLAGS
jgi:adenylate cyclase